MAWRKEREGVVLRVLIINKTHRFQNREGENYSAWAENKNKRRRKVE